MRSRQRWSALAALTGALLLFFNFLWHGGDTDLGRLRWSMRYWEDVGASIHRYFGIPSVEEGVSGDETGRAAKRDLLRDRTVARVRHLAIKPFQFWRVVADKPLLRDLDLLPRARVNQDTGRHRFLALGYRLLGGISPFLPLWLGLLVYCPVFLWTLLEFRWAGRPWTAGVFALLVGASLFVNSVLWLPHSAAGFYLIALLALPGLAAYTCIGKATRLGLASRAAAYGALWAVCVWARHATLMLAGGYLLALAIGAWRAHDTASPRSRLACFGLLAGLFVAPHLAARDSIQRPRWFTAWEGLGDFDRKYGHTWLDPVAVDVARRAGVDTGPDQIGWSGPATERFLRATVLQHIREDPVWFAEILAKRFAWTTTLRWLWPWSYWSGEMMTTSDSPQQGMQDSYFRMAWPIDFLVAGPWNVELPIPLIIAPTVILFLLCLARSTGLAKRSRRSATSLLCVAVAALTHPVLLTTCSGMEPQMFALVYFLGVALLADSKGDPTSTSLA